MMQNYIVQLEALKVTLQRSAEDLARQKSDHDTAADTSQPSRQSSVHRVCVCYRACQLYKNISMLFLFPAKDGKLSTGVNATFDASCYG